MLVNCGRYAVTLAVSMFTLVAWPISISSAQPPKELAPSDGGESEETYDRDSPRASMIHFLTLARSGDFEAAADYLELGSRPDTEGAELARKLKAVLDRRVWVEVETLSPLATGDTDDGLPPYTDEIGTISNEQRVPEPVRIVRRKRDVIRWMFSHATVMRIEGWYKALGDRWVLENLPQPLLRSGPRDLMYWQWLALPLLFGLSWALAYPLAAVSAFVLGKIAARSKYKWDDQVVERLRKPMTLWCALIVAYLGLPWLALYAPAERFVLRVLNALFLVGFFWGAARVIDIGAQTILQTPWAATRSSSGSLISLGARVAQVAVIAIAMVALLSSLGYPVASILAGLGVGGLAVALAAQKTVENLFGAFSIGADQPFREGDLVKVGDFTGTCEVIGLRSTKFRTADRTVISIPNGKLADMQLETFARRDRLRFFMTLGLVRTTTVAQMRRIVEQVGALLREHPKLFPGSATVRFEKFGPSSLDISLECFFDTRNWAEFTALRQETLLSIMEIVEQAGSTLALNAQHVQLLQQGQGLEPTSHATRDTVASERVPKSTTS